MTGRSKELVAARMISLIDRSLLLVPVQRLEARARHAQKLLGNANFDDAPIGHDHNGVIVDDGSCGRRSTSVSGNVRSQLTNTVRDRDDSRVAQGRL